MKKEIKEAIEELSIDISYIKQMDEGEPWRKRVIAEKEDEIECLLKGEKELEVKPEDEDNQMRMEEILEELEEIKEMAVELSRLIENTKADVVELVNEIACS